jgi:hypothetical protein
MTECWSQNPSDRPTFSQIFEDLDKIESSLPNEPSQTLEKRFIKPSQGAVAFENWEHEQPSVHKHSYTHLSEFRKDEQKKIERDHLLSCYMEQIKKKSNQVDEKIEVKIEVKMEENPAISAPGESYLNIITWKPFEL